MYIKLTRAEAKAMLLFVSTDKLRPQMGGIHFDLTDRENPRAVATNGVVLAMLSLNITHAPGTKRVDYSGCPAKMGKNEIEASFTLGSDLIKPFLTPWRKNQASDMIVIQYKYSTGRIEISGDEHTQDANKTASGLSLEKIEDQPYPAYRKVLPADDPTNEPTQFRFAAIEPFLKAKALLSHFGTDTVWIGYRGDKKAANIDISVDHFYGIALPCAVPENVLDLVKTPGWAKS